MALEAGGALLQNRGSALDAVVEAVAVMEDHPLFNAGTGSCLNWEGEAEMDACVMVGEGRAAGAVAHVRNVKNPVLLARRVLERTDHVMLGGDGAEQFARAMGFENYDPVTEQAREQLMEMKRSVREPDDSSKWPKLSELIDEHPVWLTGTVGAVARDRTGTLAAATSTGGRVGALPGRIGDTPVPGAGTLATEDAACSATGHGEWILRQGVAFRFEKRVKEGAPAPDAAQGTLDELGEEVGRQVGLIGIDRSGSIGVGHGSPNMPHGSTDGKGEPTVRMAAGT